MATNCVMSEKFGVLLVLFRTWVESLALKVRYCIQGPNVFKVNDLFEERLRFLDPFLEGRRGDLIDDRLMWTENT